MNPAEFAAKMQVILDAGIEPDLEGPHIDADDLMCEVLIELGYGEGVNIFHNVRKWHA